VHKAVEHVSRYQKCKNVPAHIIEAYLGSRGIHPLILNVGAGQLHAAANSPPRRILGTHGIGGYVGRRAGVDSCKGRKVLNIVGNRTQTVQPVARSLRYLVSCHMCYGLQIRCVTVAY
jgi:hypothetical protein